MLGIEESNRCGKWQRIGVKRVRKERPEHEVVYSKQKGEVGDCLCNELAVV